jgi:hypothetical protein
MVKKLALLLLFGAAAIWADGLSLTIGPPIALSFPPNAPRMKSTALFAVRMNGCMDLSQARVTATGEGIVADERKTVTYSSIVVSTSTPGAYAIQRQWGNEGKWVVAVTATCGNAVAGAIVPTRLNNMVREGIQLLPHAPAKAEIDDALKAFNPAQ